MSDERMASQVDTKNVTVKNERMLEISTKVVESHSNHIVIT